MVWTITTKGNLNSYTSPFEVRCLSALGFNLLLISQIKAEILRGAVRACMR